ncbi:MAG TPA: FAD-dependent oxidoreductase [Trueperaceae bacterium]|nr:FAD-dependent oxidoreductase [Trueperaceae bacterium]
MKHYDLIIVGAGIAGASAAYEFSKQGGNVLLLEQYQFLHDKGSSHGGSRIFRYAYEDPSYVKLAIEAGLLWHELEHNLDEKLLFPTGGLDLASQDNIAIQEIQAALKASQQSYEILDAKEINKRFPAFKLEPEHIALYQKDAGVLAASRALNSLLLAAALNGADLHDNEALNKIRQRRSRDKNKLGKLQCRENNLSHRLLVR